MIRLCREVPFDIVKIPSLHPMKALAVANQGLPNITRCSLIRSLVWSTRKSTGYSHEAIVTVMSSNAPTGLTVLLSANSKMVGVGLRRLYNCNFCKVVIDITLIASPKSTRVFPMGISLIQIVTTRFPGLSKFGSRDGLKYNQTAGL